MKIKRVSYPCTWQVSMLSLLAHILLLTSSSRSTNDSDLSVLVSFKSRITSDPRGVLSLWDAASNGTNMPKPDFCRWAGVVCSNRRHPGRVTAIRLRGSGLAGIISPELGNLTYLHVLDLSDNHLEEEIPFSLGGCTKLRIMNLSVNHLSGSIPAPVGRLSKLTVFNVRSNNLTGDIPMSMSNFTALTIFSIENNQFQGQIPSWLGNLTSLTDLDLSKNSFSGHIPATLGKLTNLVYFLLLDNKLDGIVPPSMSNFTALMMFSIKNNHFQGQIPSWLGNLTSLTDLDLSKNNFSGHIPATLGKLTNLVYFILGVNKLEGIVPPSIFNISSSIEYWDLSYNQLSGSLPLDIGFKLPKLKVFTTIENQFDGPIPASFSNASALEELILRGNRYRGLIPRDIGIHGHLTRLTFGYNELQVTAPRDWDFLTSLANCSNLEILDFEHNNFSGAMPSRLANLTKELKWILLGKNQIAGTIPVELGMFQKLEKLNLAYNLFTGTLPLDIGQLSSLHDLDLSNNRFHGQIPQSLGNITQLNNLILFNNFLDGGIPASLGNLTNLRSMDVSCNFLRGQIPYEILSISSLTVLLNLSNNALNGSISTQIGLLNNLGTIDLSMNKLSSEIPDSLGGCVELRFLYLQGNLLQGQIPKGLITLRGLEKLDLSNNNLTGPIPEFLESLKFLTHLNLSFNNLSGPVPNTGIFCNATILSLTGNSMLCGGPPFLQLPSCQSMGSRQASQHRLHVLIFCIIGTLIFFTCCITAYCFSKTWIKPNVVDQENLYLNENHEIIRISYAEIHAATESFSPANLIGSGSFGTVYRGTLALDENLVTVAIKVLNLGHRGASRSFLNECDALRRIRHRKLVKVITVCSTLDRNGDDFKALVLEFVCNGSLNEWLHPNTTTNRTIFRRLSLMKRLYIALDVAEALEYLHHHIEPPIVHCDIKPSNILLDDDMVAHVTDFGLAKIMHAEAYKQNPAGTESSSFVIKGTIGYVAPEYGTGSEVSTYGDIYSYGVLLLEMFTGRKPTDSFINGVASLVNYAKMAYPNNLLEILDVTATYGGNTQDIVDLFIDPIFRLALACCPDSPRQRMKMDDVVKELNAIKKGCAVHEL